MLSYQKSDSVNQCIFSWRTILQNFFPTPVWNDGALGFLEERHPNKNNNKMSSDMRSVPTWSEIHSYSEILQSTTTLSAGNKDPLPIQSIQYHSTSCLELSVSSYKKFCYHHHFQGTSENWTVLCCVRHGLTFLLSPSPPIQTLNIWRYL